MKAAHLIMVLLTPVVGVDRAAGAGDGPGRAQKVTTAGDGCGRSRAADRGRRFLGLPGRFAQHARRAGASCRVKQSFAGSPITGEIGQGPEQQATEPLGEGEGEGEGEHRSASRWWTKA